MIKIIGIDPGLTCTGWGAIEKSGNQLHYFDSGAIRTSPATPMPARLTLIFNGLRDVCARIHPDVAVVEETIVNPSARSSLKLGHARAVAVLVPALDNIDVVEYAPNAIKKSVTGRGHADKRQIQMMVKTLLPLSPSGLSHDICDALAAAMCHGHHIGMNKALERARA